MAVLKLCGLALLAIAAFPGALGRVHEQLLAIPQGWSLATGIPDRSLATFTIALKQEFEGLEQKLLDVSTPGSPNYGKFLDREAVEALFPPPKAAAEHVVAWLEENGIANYKVDGAFIDFVMEIGTANQMLDASYQNYKNGNTTKLRTLHYSVPDDIQQHIAFVDPGTFFGHALRPRVTLSDSTEETDTQHLSSKLTIDPSCNTRATPSCLKQFYNVGDYQADAKSGSRIAFSSFLNESATYSDLADFEKAFDIPSQNFTKIIIEGGIDNQDPRASIHGEANLDLQTMIGVGHPLPVTEILCGGAPPFIPTPGQPTPDKNNNEPYVPFYRYLLSKKNEELPQVLSMSYGDQEDGVPRDYANLTCNLIALMGIRGTTVLASSGDGGLGGGCIAADFKTTRFTGAVFPSTCPYLTAVGGTTGAPEKVWSGSGGGFSGYFSRPKYQDTAVGGYLDTRISNATKAYYGAYTDFTGRATPDISAAAEHVRVSSRGSLESTGGTSASSPIVGAVIGLLNDARLRAGKPTLGWLNPLLYGLGTPGINDITTGSTPGCRPSRTDTGGVPWARWNATAGWDPTTGFGVPDFQKLKEIVLKL